MREHRNRSEFMSQFARERLLYVNRDGQNYGPYQLVEAQKHLRDGSLNAHDWAFEEGDAEMKSLEEILRQRISHGGGISTPAQRRQTVSRRSPPTMRLSKVVGFITVAALIIVGVIASDGVNRYLEASKYKEWLSDVGPLLKEAHRLSVATTQGVQKKEFIEAYSAINYEWSRLRYAPAIGRNRDQITTHLTKAMLAWEGAKAVWELREEYKVRRTTPSNSTFGTAMIALKEGIGEEKYEILDKAAKRDGNVLLEEVNLEHLIAICFGQASGELSTAELHFPHVK